MTQQQRLKTQVLVIGAGISGSTSALTLADAGYEVTLIVPGKELDGGNSALAQGGIVYRSDPNDAKDLEKDILIAGHHHNYVKAVRHLCQHGPEAVERILMERAPIPFDRLDGKLDFTREGGHGKHRIVHCADHTGKTIMEGLLQAVRMSPNIRILTGRTAVDLITTDHHARYKEYRYQLDNQCLGAYVYNEDTREVETLLADFTVLATGGVGQVYLHRRLHRFGHRHGPARGRASRQSGIRSVPPDRAVYPPVAQLPDHGGHARRRGPPHERQGRILHEAL